MSTWLIAAMGVVYLYVAAEQMWKGSLGTAIMFLGYAIGNAGLVIVAKQCILLQWQRLAPLKSNQFSEKKETRWLQKIPVQ